MKHIIKRTNGFKSASRTSYIEECRQSRRNAKLQCKDCCSFNCEEAISTSQQTLSIIFDPLFIKGGPLLVSRVFSNMTYKDDKSSNLLDKIEKGFYDDFDPYDMLEIKTKYPGLGPQEVLESLLDLSVGDYDVRL